MLDEEELKGVPLIIFANKQDLKDAMTELEVFINNFMLQYKDIRIHGDDQSPRQIMGHFQMFSIKRSWIGGRHGMVGKPAKSNRLKMK